MAQRPAGAAPSSGSQEDGQKGRRAAAAITSVCQHMGNSQAATCHAVTRRGSSERRAPTRIVQEEDASRTMLSYVSFAMKGLHRAKAQVTARGRPQKCCRAERQEQRDGTRRTAHEARARREEQHAAADDPLGVVPPSAHLPSPHPGYHAHAHVHAQAPMSPPYRGAADGRSGEMLPLNVHRSAAQLVWESEGQIGSLPGHHLYHATLRLPPDQSSSQTSGGRIRELTSGPNAVSSVVSGQCSLMVHVPLPPARSRTPPQPLFCRCRPRGRSR